MDRRGAWAVLALGVIGCGGGGGSAGPTPAPVLSVGGDYAMAVALIDNSCGAVTVQPLPTRVVHTPGSTQIQLTHGPATYAGTVDASGRFATQPRTFDDVNGSQTVAIAGQFSTGGLEATATVDVRPAAGAVCRYLARWTGTKVGAPNVIP